MSLLILTNSLAVREDVRFGLGKELASQTGWRWELACLLSFSAFLLGVLLGRRERESHYQPHPLVQEAILSIDTYIYLVKGERRAANS